MDTPTPPSGEQQEDGPSRSDVVAAVTKAQAAMATPAGRRAMAERRRKARHRELPLLPEVRHFKATGLEVRSSKDTDEIVITGSPIIYAVPYPVWDMFGEFRETMNPGVADPVLARGADVRFLFNHDGLPLARNTSGTMKVVSLSASLDFEARLDGRQQLANDLAIAIERGDVSQMSCGFIVARDEWGWDDDEDVETRLVYEFEDLLDFSAVTYPASPTTSIAVMRRMALEVPIESRARVAHLLREARAGKALSGTTTGYVNAALQALHDLFAQNGEDFEPADGSPTAQAAAINDGSDTPAGETADGGSEAEDMDVSTDGTLGGGDQSSAGDGSGSRSRGWRDAPATADERRDQSLSLGDQETAVYHALAAKFGADADLWIYDLGTDWVVYDNFVVTCDLCQLSYEIDDAGNVTLGDEPQLVQPHTTYVPATRADDQPEDESKHKPSSRARHLRLQAEARKRRRPNV